MLSNIFRYPTGRAYGRCTPHWGAPAEARGPLSPGYGMAGRGMSERTSARPGLVLTGRAVWGTQA